MSYRGRPRFKLLRINDNSVIRSLKDCLVLDFIIISILNVILWLFI